jgi:two-component system phosphate regulon sensor histidine kinase PhoR
MSEPEPRSSLDDLVELADQTGLGVMRFDDRGSVVTANAAAHRLLERPADGLVGRTVMEAFVDHRLESLVRAATRGEAGSHEVGSSERLDLMVYAHPAGGGGAWVMLEDITELRRLQRIRTEFIDNLSHELRTPLANVRLLAEMLTEDLKKADVSDRARERVATIEVESGHLTQMINELLDLSRIEQATPQIRHDEVAIGPLVHGAASRLSAFTERQGVELREQVSEGLPPIRGDEERLDQLLVNLLHNAIKFSPRGSAVILAAEQRSGSVVLSVSDQGDGIPAEEQERVFERFYKVDRARHRGQGGTGLGLAIARNIAEAHGGRLWLESTEGQGSTFSVSLPIA